MGAGQSHYARIRNWRWKRGTGIRREPGAMRAGRVISQARRIRLNFCGIRMVTRCTPRVSAQRWHRQFNRYYQQFFFFLLIYSFKVVLLGSQPNVRSHLGFVTGVPQIAVPAALSGVRKYLVRRNGFVGLRQALTFARIKDSSCLSSTPSPKLWFANSVWKNLNRPLV